LPKTYPRPRFVREESWRYKRVKGSWRSPRGKTSRVRRSKKGWPAVVKVGYGKAKHMKGIHPSGLREVIVQRAQDLAKVNPETQAVRIAHTVGENKRALILDEAKKLNIKVLNPAPKPTEAEAAEVTPPEEGSKEEARRAPETSGEEAASAQSESAK